MTQDCLNPSFTANVSASLPKGIHVIGTEKLSAPKVEGVSIRKRVHKQEDPSTQPTSWSYLFLQHMAARVFQKWMEVYNRDKPKQLQQPFFIHQTYRYYYKDEENQRGVKKVLEPSVSGLIFLQGTVRSIQEFLKENFPQYHLVNDRSRKRPASISDSIMQPFMNVMKTHPDQVTFLRDTFEKFAKDHVKLRILTGVFQGLEGYIIRIDRDRQLVFDFGGNAVSIRGIHNETFEVVEE